jgi:hypothetical protein
MDLFDEYGEDELLIISIENLGLESKAWNFTRGEKTTREYVDENDDIKVSVVYTYTHEDNGRKPTPITRTINWYDTNGDIQLSKVKNLNYSVKSLKEVQRSIYQGRLDYMIGAGEQLAELSLVYTEPYKSSFALAAQSVDTILAHYEIEINHYIARGTQEFEDAVRNELDSTINSLLDIVVRPPDAYFSAGLTIRQTILHQLTGEYTP